MNFSNILNFLHCIWITACEHIAGLDLNQVNELCRNGNYREARSYYESCFGKTKTNGRLNHEYYIFLMKMGDIEKILELNEYFGLDNGTMSELKRDLSILKTGINRDIKTLLNKYPNSFDIVYAAAVSAFEAKDRTKFKSLLNKLKFINGDDKRILILEGRVALIDGDFKKGIELFREIGETHFADVATAIIQKIDECNRIAQPLHKARNLIRVYDNISQLIIRDKYKPSLYTKMGMNILEKICEICLASSLTGGTMYAKKLTILEPEQLKYSIFYIRLLIVDDRHTEASEMYNQIKGKLSPEIRTYIEKELNKLEAKLNEARRQEAERQRQQEEARRRQRRQHGGTEKAGKDFKDFYKTLGVTKAATEKEIKKAWKKAARKAQREISINEKKTGERDESALIKVNKAYEVLGDKDKKETYDNGVDPTDTQANARYQHHNQFDFGGFGGGGWDDFGDVFEQFFSGGGGFSSGHGTGGRRTFRRIVFQ